MPGTSLERDQIIDAIMGRLLQVGVTAAALFVFLGGVIYLSDHASPTVNYHVFSGEPAEYRTLSGIALDAFTLHGRGLIQFGLLILIATPIARVCYSALAFLFERDWKYVTFTLVVLSLLLYSLLRGLG
jgi:uncharacterized membrane protein